MRRIALVALAIGFIAPVLATAPAHAQATRTWVSGVGDDVNPCSRTAPCKTFAGAISKTATAGEISCLDPGGFGTVTITKSMTLNCGATLGSILAAGVPGITINGAGALVVLRGLQINGVQGTATPGTIGVRIIAAATVSIEDTVITQFSQQGISDQRTSSNTKLFIRNSVVSNNVDTGIQLIATGSSNRSDIVNTSSINNLFGVAAGTSNSVMVRGSVMSGNGTGVEADSGASIDVDNSSIANNTTLGVQANGGIIRLSNSDVSFNVTGLGGSIAAVTYGNNRLLGNGTLGTVPTAAGAAAPALGQQ
jgi:hypothetical protein